MATAPPEIKRKIWKRYIDDLFEIIKKDQRDPFTNHLNSINPTGSIKFIDGPEVEKTTCFLDAQITRKEDGTLKVKVYTKKTHTNQHLNYEFYHPLNHQLGVVRTLYERADNITTEPEDQKQEVVHVNNALKMCGYNEWSFKEVRKIMNNIIQNSKRTREERNRRRVMDKRLW